MHCSTHCAKLSQRLNAVRISWTTLTDFINGIFHIGGCDSCHQMKKKRNKKGKGKAHWEFKREPSICRLRSLEAYWGRIQGPEMMPNTVLFNPVTTWQRCFMLISPFEKVGIWLLCASVSSRVSVIYEWVLLFHLRFTATSGAYRMAAGLLNRFF